MSATILILDHNQQRQRELGAAIERMNHRPLAAFTVHEARQLFAGQFYSVDLIIVNLDTRDLDIESFIDRAQQLLPDIPLIVQGSPEDREAIHMAIEKGAYDFLRYPSSEERLNLVIRNALRISWLWRESRDSETRAGRQISHAFVNRSPAMRAFRADVATLEEAASFNLFISSGTPEGSVFDYLSQTFRSGAPIVRLSADQPKPIMPGPALFIIQRPSDWSSAALAALTAPDAGHWHIFVAGDETRPSALQNLPELAFPKLADRKEDLDGIVDLALMYSASRPGGHALTLSTEVRSALQHYHWPGGVRELFNMFQKAQLLTQEDMLLPVDFPEIFNESGRRVLVRGEIREGGLFTYSGGEEIQHTDDATPPSEIKSAKAGPYASLIDTQGQIRPFTEVEKDCILHALVASKNNVSAAAKSLGLGRATLYRKLKSYGIKV